MQSFAQIGAPHNLTVTPKEDGDGYVVSWEPPEHGLDTLRVFLIKWYREPGHLLHGTAETRGYYYTGTTYIL